ncbi:hypothetical protein BGZ82_000270 [Podila clonocystis]|nr:hypothetical protein BGZ82_000270 [Podila clonocystis]
MKFTQSFTAAVLVTLAVAAHSAQAITYGCYVLCVKNGSSSKYCQDQCFDPKCYRDCTKDGGSSKYCRDSCID